MGYGNFCNIAEFDGRIMGYRNFCNIDDFDFPSFAKELQSYDIITETTCLIPF